MKAKGATSYGWRLDYARGTISGMKAIVLTDVKSPLIAQQRPDLVPNPGQVVIQLKAAALNRRDYWITQGMYPGIKTPVILGSDGAGVVTAVGDEVASSWIDKEVILNPGMDWDAADGTRSTRSQDPAFRILGMPDDGTFAEQVAVDAKYVHEKPAHLDWHQAAALPLAGVTAYRAVFTQGQLQPGQKMLVSGVGGGVATFALQFGVHAGADVSVTSSSAAKIEKAKELGALAGFDYTKTEWHKPVMKEHGMQQLIIDSAGGDGYAAMVELADFGGRIVNYGATAGSPGPLDMFKVFWKQLTLQGTTMGSPEDFGRMIEFVNMKKVVPAIDQVFGLEDANDALALMKNSEQFGKIVLSM